MNAPRLVIVLGAVMGPGACGDNHEVPADAGPCWPLVSKPGGSVEMGSGDVDWEPMPSAVQIVRNGSQSDPYLYVHARMRGMPPGDPNDFFHPDNPKTKVNLVVDELGLSLGLDCPATIGFLPATEAGAYDMLHALRIGFGVNALDQIEGKQARITIEIVGANGLYASDQETVVLSGPPSL